MREDVSRWVTSPGASGTVTVERTEEGRLVADIGSFDREVVVLLEEGAGDVAESGAETIGIEVVAFRRAHGAGPHYLTARPAVDGDSGTSDATARGDEPPSTIEEPSRATDFPGRDGRSVVGEARARAGEQQRDAAIDPAFSPRENRNHLLNEASERSEDGSEDDGG